MINQIITLTVEYEDFCVKFWLPKTSMALNQWTIFGILINQREIAQSIACSWFWPTTMPMGNTRFPNRNECLFKFWDRSYSNTWRYELVIVSAILAIVWWLMELTGMPCFEVIYTLKAMINLGFWPHLQTQLHFQWMSLVVGIQSPPCRVPVNWVSEQTV
jgi:hypothetical protein